jgi:hypothetical protein
VNYKKEQKDNLMGHSKNKFCDACLLRCDASNPATTAPLQSEIKLLVRFKPSFVTISAEPDNPKAGSKAILVRI